MIKPPTRILLFKLRYIGDVILTTPAIRLLRESYPEARITMVVNKGTEDVLRYNPHLDQVLTIDREKIKRGSFCGILRSEWKFLKQLRKERFDLSIDFASGDRAAFLSLLSGVPFRVGFYAPEGYRRWILNRAVMVSGPIHTVERNLILLKEILGLEARDASLVLPIGRAEEHYVVRWLRKNRIAGKDLVVIHPGARFWFKRWPTEQWARLIDLLQGDLGLQVVLSGGAQDKELIETITSSLKTPVHSLAGQTTVLQLAALMKQATLFIGNDSGPMHIAAAVGTYVIALFGPTEPAVWRPWGERHVVISRQPSCSPCGDGRCAFSGENCMERIAVEEIVAAVSQCLERPLPPSFRTSGSSSIEAGPPGPFHPP